MAKKVTKKKAVASKTSKKTKTAMPSATKTVKTAKSVKKSVKKTTKKSTSKPSASKKNGALPSKTTSPTLAAQESSVPSVKTDRGAPVKVKTYLTKPELKHFRRLLVSRLKEIIGDVNHFEREILKKSRQDAAGDLSSMPIHMADIGSDNYEQEFTIGLMNNERKTVQEILLALQRIEEGTYGMCEGTGEPIFKPRLEAFPWARFSVKYAEMIEKGQVVEVAETDLSNGRIASMLTETDELWEEADDHEEQAEYAEDYGDDFDDDK